MTTWLWAGLGFAGAAEPCESSLDQLLDEVGRVESALESSEPELASGAALRLRASLPCLDERLPALAAPRLYRAIGAGLLMQRHPESLGWLRTAAVHDPGFRYSIDLVPEGSPVFSAWQQARESVAGLEPEPMPHRVFGPGVHWLDGHALVTPVAVPGVPHVYQHEAGGGAPIDTELIWGPDFPDAHVLLQGVSDAPHVVLDGSTPTVASPVVSGPEVYRPPNKRSARAAVLVSGGTLLVGSGVLVGLSVAHRENAPRIADRLAIGAGATGATGLLTLGIGMLLTQVDDDPRPTLDVRF